MAIAVGFQMAKGLTLALSLSLSLSLSLAPTATQIGNSPKAIRKQLDAETDFLMQINLDLWNTSSCTKREPRRIRMKRS